MSLILRRRPVAKPIRIAASLCGLAMLAAVPALAQTLPPPSPNVTVFAEGLENPRGLHFGPDGYLYVAEGGEGGTNSTVGTGAQQVPPPIGPYTGGPTARISKVAPSGARTTVTEGLPSTQTSPASGGAISGVADVAFRNNTLYALVTGGGASHGNPDAPNGLYRIASDGSYTLVVDLGEYLRTHPVQAPEEDDFEPDGSWYSMLPITDGFLLVEANHGEVDKVTPGGAVSRIADISAAFGHAVPTASAMNGQDLYVGTLSTFPIEPGSASVLKVAPDGTVTKVFGGFTTVVGLAFDPQGRLYVLQMSTAGPKPTPGTGNIVRVAPDGTQEVVASGLTFPTAMTFGPDGKLYVSNIGFGLPPGAGQVVRVDVGITLPTGDVTGDGQVTVDDVRTLLEYVVGMRVLLPTQQAQADANGDGVIDLKDAVAIIHLAVATPPPGAKM